jgi:hypothetical protein
MQDAIVISALLIFLSVALSTFVMYKAMQIFLSKADHWMNDFSDEIPDRTGIVPRNLHQKTIEYIWAQLCSNRDTQLIALAMGLEDFEKIMKEINIILEKGIQ